MSNKGEGRRLSGNIPLAYDRQQPGPYSEHSLPTPPVPPAVYPPYYDRFAPEEPTPSPYHEGYTQEYNPKYWRTDREYLPRTPSPERFRPAQTEAWPRPPAWQESEPVAWPDRREPVREPYNTQWDRPARETPTTRMFEPSATWKQTHTGPLPYPESISQPRERPAERFPEPPLREYRERQLERSRPHDVYSPSQPAPERFRPHTSPMALASVARNRIPYVTPRSDNNRPPHLEPEWAPEDDDLYADRGEARSKEPLNVFSARSGSQGRVDRRFHSRDSVERSVSPASSRPAQHSSPEYMAPGLSVPKRESPDLPHLEPLPFKPSVSQLVRIPLGPESLTSSLPKSVSRSPSHSSTASSLHLHNASRSPLERADQPKAIQLQTSSGPSSVTSHPTSRLQTKSPALQISPVARVSPGVDSLASTPRNEQASSRPTAAPSNSHTQSSIDSSREITNSQSVRSPQSRGLPNNGHRSYLHRAPSFVPSTLAIDAKLKFPESGVAVNTPPQSAQARPSTSSAERSLPQAVCDHGRNDAESDMDMSLPASPVKGLRETKEAHVNDPEESRVTSDNAEDLADSSDMDMSPPASPALKPVADPARSTPLRTLTTRADHEEKVEATRPALSIDTSITSSQNSRPVPRKRAPPSSTASTPEPGCDESDMEMSSPSSSAAPSPRPTSSLLLAQPASKFSITQELLLASAEKINLTVVPVTAPGTTSLVSDPPSPTRRDAAVSPISRHASLANSQQTPTALRIDTSSDRAFMDRSDAAPQSPSRIVPSAERNHAEAVELSPPVSEETLREETEGVEKDLDTVMHSQKERPSTIQKATVVTLDQAMTDAEKMITELPLSDALRLVVSLRIRRNTPLALLEDHVEPIIRSNLSIAEPEQRERQPEAIIEAVTEREHQQATKGAYDGTKHSLRKRFATHRAALAEKVDRLRKDYLALHEKWMVHCARLDDIARANALEEAAATAGRTTRRSAAMGDAVRTDLEMEQILASLGNEELTDANHLSAKNAAVIPDMLSVTKGRADPMFDDTNNLVEDPHSFYALETGINDWSDEEKAAFLEKYVVHPKQFGIIAGFLPNKTPAQCVTFFYLHKNTTIDFRKLVADHNTVGKRTRRGRGGKQKGNALLADILKHDDEVSRDSTPNTTSGRRRRGHVSAPLPVATPLSETAPDAGPSTMPVIDQSKRPSVSRRSTAQTTPTPTPDPEPSSKRPRRRANLTAKAVAALGQEEGDDAPEEDVRPAKRTRRARKSKVAEAEAVPSSATTEVVAVLSASSETKFIDQTEAAARRKSATGGVNWSDADKDLFLKLLRQHGDDFKRIAASMPNKTTIQVTSFYNANLNDMELAKVAALAPKRSPTPSGSGASIQSSTNPSTPAFDNHFATGADIHSNNTSGVPSNPQSHGTLASFAPSDAALSGPPTMSHRSAPVEPVRPHPPATISSPGVPASPHVPGMTQNPTRNGAPSNPGPSTPSPLPASMTSTFPSFPYTNLGPSHFGNAPLEPSAFVRLSAPQATGGSMSHPVMEFSNFAPQPWMSGAHSLVGQSPILHGSQMPGLPATLETTEDLVRYLEHRTRLTAGQNNDNDFM